MTRMPKPRPMTPQQIQDGAMATVQRIRTNGRDRGDTAAKTDQKSTPKPRGN